jgi:hypothetical protein
VGLWAPSGCVEATSGARLRPHWTRGGGSGCAPAAARVPYEPCAPHTVRLSPQTLAIPTQRVSLSGWAQLSWALQCHKTRTARTYIHIQSKPRRCHSNPLTTLQTGRQCPGAAHSLVSPVRVWGGCVCVGGWVGGTQCGVCCAFGPCSWTRAPSSATPSPTRRPAPSPAAAAACCWPAGCTRGPAPSRSGSGWWRSCSAARRQRRAGRRGGRAWRCGSTGASTRRR